MKAGGWGAREFENLYRRLLAVQGSQPISTPHAPGRSRDLDSSLHDFTSDADAFCQQSVVVTSLYRRVLLVASVQQ
jgi:hypothetical protein